MADNSGQLVEACKRCDFFFKEALDKAVKNQRADVSPETAFYLLTLLTIGVKAVPRPDSQKVDKHKEDKQTLAQKFWEASFNNQTNILRIIGDHSLIIAGIWWQSLLKKRVDVSYYASIGASSYKMVSESGPGNLAETFEELSENFEKLADVLTEAVCCISEAPMSDKDILDQYEKWLRTHNKSIARKLRSLGINVGDAIQ